MPNSSNTSVPASFLRRESRPSECHPPKGCLGISHLHPYLLKSAEQGFVLSFIYSLLLKRTLCLNMAPPRQCSFDYFDTRPPGNTKLDIGSAHKKEEAPLRGLPEISLVAGTGLEPVTFGL